MKHYIDEDPPAYINLLKKEWVENFDNKKSVFYRITNWARALRVARYRTVCKLLKEKQVTFEELGLVEHY